VELVFKVVKSIDSSKPVIFFCLAGAHRSAFTCVCYLMYLYQDKNFDAIYEKIKKRRNIIEMLGFRPLLE
jgi:protein-tyrosine phosphatase